MNTLTINASTKNPDRLVLFKIIIVCMFSLLTWQNSMAVTFKNVPIKPVISKNKFTRPMSIQNPTRNSQCPKLEIRGLRIKKVDFYNHNYLIYLSGHVKNIGGADFPSVRKNQKVVYRAKGIPTTTSSFGSIPKGRSVPFEGLIRGNMGGEFTPDIRVKIQLNKLPKNRNSACIEKASGYKIYSQPEVIISRKEVNRAIANYHRSHPKAPVTVRKPDYMFQPNPLNGTFQIKNMGPGNTVATEVYFSCRKNKFHGRDRKKGCPKVLLNTLSVDSNYPILYYVLHIPALRAGQRITLRFPGQHTPGAKYKKGIYYFEFIVDFKNKVHERDEANNRRRVDLTVH